MAGRNLFLAAITLALLQLTPALAQTAADGLLIANQPSWNRLNAQQRTALAPLSHDWNSLPDARKQKWLGIARRYTRLSPVEQARMQDRMREWVALTPVQRETVRNQFKTLRTSPEQRNELGRKWKEYEALPDEEKERLAQTAPKARLSAIPPSAASAVPVSPYAAAVPRFLNQTPPGGKSRPLASASGTLAP